MDNLELEYDFKFLNLFNFVLNLKKGIASSSRIRPETKKSLLSEFEENLLKNMKILSFKAFGRSSSVGKRFTSLMEDLKKMHKRSTRSKSVKIRPIVCQVWENFEEKMKPLLAFGRGDMGGDGPGLSQNAV